MIKKMNSVLLFSAFLFLIFNTNLYAQNAGARFLLWKPSAKSMSLGGSGAARFDGASSAYFNPALIAQTKSLNAAGSFVKPLPFFNNIAHSYNAVSFRLLDYGYLAVSGNLFWRAEYVTTPKYLLSWQGKISYAANISDWLAVGASMGYLHYKLTSAIVGSESSKGKTNTMSFDFGAAVSSLLPGLTFSLPDQGISLFSEIAPAESKQGINFGLSILNLGPEITLIDKEQADPMSSVLLAGISYHAVSSDFFGLTISTDLENQINEDLAFEFVRLGTDISLLRIFSLRWGYVSSLSSKYKSFAAFGGGINTKFVSFNIARYNSTFRPAWHFDAGVKMEF